MKWLTHTNDTWWMHFNVFHLKYKMCQPYRHRHQCKAPCVEHLLVDNIDGTSFNDKLSLSLFRQYTRNSADVAILSKCMLVYFELLRARVLLLSARLMNIIGKCETYFPGWCTLYVPDITTSKNELLYWYTLSDTFVKYLTARLRHDTTLKYSDLRVWRVSVCIDVTGSWYRQEFNMSSTMTALALGGERTTGQSVRTQNGR